MCADNAVHWDMPMATSPAVVAKETAPTDVPKDKRSRIPWMKIVLESSFVMLGVLLALIADEWRQNRDDERRADRALVSVIEELGLNRAAVAQSLAYHLELTQRLSQLQTSSGGQANATTPDRDVFQKGFLHPASMISTAWDSAKATDVVSHMPYDQVLTLAHIYDQQRSYADQSHEVEQLIFAKLFNEGFEAMLRNHANLLTVISTFWFRECQLLREYDQSFEKLGAAATSTPAMPEICQRVPSP
jgi:hypothetical protein